MADFTALKTAIQNAIKQNGNEEITGNLLQEVLLAIVTTLGDGSINDLVTALGSEATTRQQADGTLQQNINAEAQARQQADGTLQQNINAEAQARQQGDSTLQGGINTAMQAINAINAAIGNGYVYAGIATPSSTPTTGKVFYLALTAGTYTNFGNTAVTQGINILKYNGSAWSLDAFAGIDDTPTQGSNNLVKSGGVLDSIIKDGSAFDLSAYNGGATYADLNAALIALNALPAAYKRGGMSVKFVQTSDNKYIQARCMAKNFTTDTTQWTIAEEGVYVDNPEFVYVKTDKDDKILWAIKKDGGIYYGAGVPQQVIDYIEEKLADLSLDEYENIVAFLNGIEEGDKTLQTLLNEKVDKEEGKSLIPTQYIQEIENPEFIKAELDVEQKLLGGIKKDGTYWFNKVESPTLDNLQKEVNDAVEESQKALIEHYDYYNVSKHHTIRDVFNIYTANTGWQQVEYDSTAAMYDELDVYQIGEVCNYGGDTEHSYEALISQRGVAPAIITKEYVTRRKFTLDEAVSLLPTEILTAFAAGQMICFTDIDDIVEEWQLSESGSWVRVNPYEIKDPESRVEIKLDNDNKIIAYRKADGTWVECVGIETNHLKLTEQGMNDFQQALKDAGFQPGGAGDWSDYISNDGDNPLCIPEPRCALVNISGVESMPTRKGVDMQAYFEMWDMQGNYFKKKVFLNAQGNSSMQFVKKNFAIDLFDEDWDDDAFGIKIGNWVKQDSYHFKSFYIDYFKGVSNIAYKIADLVDKTNDFYNDRIWKKALLGGYKIGSDSFTAPQIKDVNLQIDNGARCMPDGFPCVVYLNGEFYGLFAWCLKKHRDNYHMKKDTPTHIHLDGVLNYAHLFGANGNSANIGWDPTGDNGFEVRNPKDDYLVTTEATKYDADAGTKQELAGVAILGEVISTYDATYAYAKQDLCKVDKKIFMSKVDDNVGNDPSLASYGSKPKDVFKKATDYWIEVTFTNETKETILRLSTYIPNIKAAETIEDKKALIEQYFDVDNLIDYIVVNMAVYDEDSYTKNWQWLTYDGIKWFAAEYDKDCSFGNNWTGMFTSKVKENGGWVEHEGSSMASAESPLKYIIAYYQEDIKARWNELVTKGIFTKETFISIVNDWVSRFGAVNFEREFLKWKESPCNRDNGVDSHWKLIDVYTGSTSGTGDYDSERTYEPGDICVEKNPVSARWYFKFECVEECTGVYPFIQVSNNNPQYLGYRDSLWRLYNYIIENLYNQNIFINNL